MDEELGDSVRRVDPDRWLSACFVGDQEARADLLALYAFDHQLARAPRVASNSIIAEIRLTWWREAMEEMIEGRPVRGHPIAQALARAVTRRDLSFEALEAMIIARVEVLDRQTLDMPAAMRWADGVGGSVAFLAARILDPASLSSAAAPAGRAWALATLGAQGVVDADEIERHLGAILPEARHAARGLSVRAFPAVAHVTLAPWFRRARSHAPLLRRLKLTGAIATGRL